MVQLRLVQFDRHSLWVNPVALKIFLRMITEKTHVFDSVPNAAFSISSPRESISNFQIWLFAWKMVFDSKLLFFGKIYWNSVWMCGRLVYLLSQYFLLNKAIVICNKKVNLNLSPSLFICGLPNKIFQSRFVAIVTLVLQKL